MKKYALLYCRVSDPSQVEKGHSIELQEPILRKFAEDEGYEVLKVFTDKAKTATTTVGRDELMNALNYIQTDLKNYDRKKNEIALVVLDTDRLARNEEDHFGIRAFLKKQKVMLVSKNQPGINDSAEGKLMDTVMAGVNAFQSRMIGRKVGTVKQELAEQGRTTYKSPFGYLNVNLGTEKNPDRTVVINPETSVQLQDMFNLYASGEHTLTSLADELKERKVRNKQDKFFRPGSISKHLTNSYYIGKVKANGKEIDGLHPKLIDEPLFQKCKAMLQRHNNYTGRKRKPENHAKFFLKPFLRCGVCGYLITGETTGRHVKKYDYYRCIRPKSDEKYHSNANECARMKEVEGAIETFLGMIRMSDGVIDEVLQRAKEVLSETHGEVDGAKRRLSNEIEKLEARRTNMETMWLDKDPRMSDEVYFRNHPLVENELAEARTHLATLEETRHDNTKLFESFVMLARDLPKAYRKSPPEVRKMYLTIFWDYFEIQKKEVSKAVPSKIMTALLNEKLVALKATTPEAKVLLSRVWQPHGESNSDYRNENPVS